MKPVIGAIGFLMLFFSPAEDVWMANIWKALALQSGCIMVAVLLLVYAGAFKRITNTSKP